MKRSNFKLNVAVLQMHTGNGHIHHRGLVSG